jgi:hypothetical protein
MEPKWLLDTGEGLTSILRAFRKIVKNYRLSKTNAIGTRGNGTSGSCVHKLEWKKNLRQCNKSEKPSSTPNSRHRCSSPSWDKANEFVFRNFPNDILQANFLNEDLKIVSILKIPARTTSPVRLDTARGRRQTPMAEVKHF